LINPFIVGFLLKLICNTYAKKHPQGNDMSGAMIIPIDLVFFAPYIFMFLSRFILQSIVEDKKTNMKETLRLMSLSRFSYAISFFLVQSLMVVWSGIILGLFMWDNHQVWPEGGRWHASMEFMIVMVLWGLATIGFTMCLSTMFEDPKLA
jgi:hypothetical protein